MVVKFTKAGTYTVYCDLHPGMKATVKVAKKGAKVPTAKQDAASVAKQAAAVLETAKGLETANPGANTVDLGSAGKGGGGDFGMVPSQPSLKPGPAGKIQKKS